MARRDLVDPCAHGDREVGFTEVNALDLYYMPYTHSLPGSIVLSLIFGGIVAVFTNGNRWATILLVAAASFSHWVLDLVVHTPDLPLYDMRPRSASDYGGTLR